MSRSFVPSLIRQTRVPPTEHTPTAPVVVCTAGHGNSYNAELQTAADLIEIAVSDEERDSALDAVVRIIERGA